MGPWADRGAHHWRLTGVQALPRPVVSLGWLGLWEPQPTLVADVLAMIASNTVPARQGAVLAAEFDPCR